MTAPDDTSPEERADIAAAEMDRDYPQVESGPDWQRYHYPERNWGNE